MAATEILEEKRDSALKTLLARADTVELTEVQVWQDDIEVFRDNCRPELRRLMPNYYAARKNIWKIREKMHEHEIVHEELTRWMAFPAHSLWSLPRFYYRLTSVEECLIVLQSCIEIEFATLPLYLTALYSINPQTEGGKKARALLSDVQGGIIFEEMKHFALAMNIYNFLSLGPGPVFTAPDYSKPLTLPGGCLPKLSLVLGPATNARVFYQFMAVEQPEFVQNGSVEELREGDVSLIDSTNTFTATFKKTGPDDGISPTIAQLYLTVREYLDKYDIPARNNIQIAHAGIGVFEILTKEDAIRAIDEIMLEGEGTVDTVAGGLGELSHYHKFLSLYRGQMITNMTLHETDSEMIFTYTTDGIPIGFSDADVNMSLEEERDPQFSAAYKGMVDSFASAADEQDYNKRAEKIAAAVGHMFRMRNAYETAMRQNKAPLWVTD